LPNSLELLYCYFNKLINLPALPNNLKILFCNHNKIMKLIKIDKQIDELYYDNDLIKFIDKNNIDLIEIKNKLHYKILI